MRHLNIFTHLGGAGSGSDAVKTSVLAGTYTATVSDGYVIDQIQWIVNDVPVVGATNLTWTPSPALNDGDVVTFSYNVVSASTPPLTVPTPVASISVSNNTLTASLTYKTATSFVWEQDGVAIAGANTDTYIYPINTPQGVQFTVIINGTYQSNPISTPEPPVIESSWIDFDDGSTLAFSDGSTITFSGA